MIDTQTMAAAADKLRAAGFDVPPEPTMLELSNLIESAIRRKRGKNASQSDWIAVYARPRTPPREAPPFQPLQPSPHWRQADIDAAQPPVMTPCMVGNGNENSKVWRR